MSLAAIHLREEPDALMSARPDLCGGHRATGVPTAIANQGKWENPVKRQLYGWPKSARCSDA
jgi:hypothetical protein